MESNLQFTTAVTTEEAIKTYKMVPNTPKKSNIASFLQIIGGVALLSVAGHFAMKYVPAAKDISLPVLSDPTPAVAATTDLVKIRNVKQFYMLADRDDKKIELRTGGNLSWRFNNPSKLMHGDFARAQGSLGSDGNYAIFPSLEVGMKAAEVHLFEGFYKDLTIAAAMVQFAPATKGYNATTYATVVAKAAGVPTSTIMSTLTADQRKKFLNAVRVYERWTPGKVTVFNDEEDFKARGW